MANIEEYNPNEVYYNYSGLLSKNRMVNFVIGMRGGGKSYNFKKYMIKKYLEKGEMFMIVRRRDSELEMMRKTYFNDVKQEFEEHEFIVKGNVIMIDGEEAGYFQALSTATNIRSSSFPTTQTIFFEEFIIENINTNNNYLKNEVTVLFGLCETVFRDRPGVRLIFAANNGGITNPYFDHFNIKPNPNKRYTVTDKCVVEYYDNPYFIEYKKSRKAFSDIYADTEYEKYAVYNQSLFDVGDRFIKQRPAHARYYFGINYNGVDYSFWTEIGSHEVYMTKGADKSHPFYFAVTDSDHWEQTQRLKSFRNHVRVQHVKYSYNISQLYFNDVIIRERFNEMKPFFNV